MALVVTINRHGLHIEWSQPPERESGPAIYDMSGAHIERAPQFDYEGDTSTTARVGFQPNPGGE